MSTLTNGESATNEEIAAHIRRGEPMKLETEIGYNPFDDSGITLKDFIRRQLSRGYIVFNEPTDRESGKTRLVITMGALPIEKRESFITAIYSSSLKFTIIPKKQQ